MPSRDTARSLQTGHKGTSLSNVLTRYIESATKEPGNDKSLRLYARRFALQQPFWLSANDETFELNLIELIQQYIHYIPVLVAEFDARARDIGWDKMANRLNQIIDSFFNDGYQTPSNVGLVGILDKAYFTHRLIEEMHDYMMCQHGKPVLPWDMTATNLLIHNLIGEQYGSRLDQTVIELSEKLTKDLPDLDTPKTTLGQTEWPCFCDRFGVCIPF